MSELTVTIKYGKGHEESWAVFRAPGAAAMFDDLVVYFGLAEEDVDGLTLHALVTKVTEIAHGSATAARVLGGKVVTATEKTPPAPASAATGSSAWKQAEQEQPAEEPDATGAGVLPLIEAATSVDELKQVYARNQSAFSEPDVLAAYKARGKALQAQAKEAA